MVGPPRLRRWEFQALSALSLFKIGANFAEIGFRFASFISRVSTLRCSLGRGGRGGLVLFTYSLSHQSGRCAFLRQQAYTCLEIETNPGTHSHQPHDPDMSPR
jgi:hypothetical protein